MTLYLDTLRALTAPRRAIPIALLVGAMLWSQARTLGGGPGTLRLLAPGLAMALTFVALAPYAWRALAPPDARVGLLRWLAFGVLATVPSGVGWAVGEVLGLGYTFLTWRFHLPITAAMFAVGGWGLARDIEQEEGLARSRARAAALEREAERARLLAQRAHLDPHFLFNTLNALAEWTREDPATAEDGLLRLSALLRELLGGLRLPAWSVQRELGLVRDLLELHRLRDPAWFTLVWDVPDGLDAEVPPLLLLPLAENAVKHGPAKGHRGELGVRVRQGARLTVSVWNPGPFAGRRADGEGLSTLERRLDLAYGGDGRLTIHGEVDRTEVSVDVPLRTVEVA